MYNRIYISTAFTYSWKIHEKMAKVIMWLPLEGDIFLLTAFSFVFSPFKFKLVNI